jgi:hypothetical protein
MEAKGEMAYHEFLNLLEPHTRRYTDYGREHQKFVLEMMKQYELCHVYSGNAASREKVVVPSAFSRQSPAKAANHVCGLKVRIFLNFNPTTILQKIVVRCLRDGMTAPDEAWYSGAMVKSSPGSLAKVESNEADNSITIGVQWHDGLASVRLIVNWIRELASHRSGSAIRGEFVSLQHLLQVQEDHFVELDRIQAHIEENEDYLHPSPRKKISVAQLKGIEIPVNQQPRNNVPFGFRQNLDS